MKKRTIFQTKQLAALFLALSLVLEPCQAGAYEATQAEGDSPETDIVSANAWATKTVSANAWEEAGGQEASPVLEDVATGEIPADQETVTYEYGLKAGSQMIIEGEKFVYWDGEVLRTSLSDGQGGSIVFDPPTMTLTIDHYHFQEDFTEQYLFIDKMPDLTIVLKGYSIMKKQDRSNESSNIRIGDTNCKFTGSGTLESNMHISGGGGKLTIEDCTMILHGQYYGLGGANLSIHNATLDLAVEEKAPAWAGAIYAEGNVSIDDSVVRLSSASCSDWRCYMQMANPTLVQNVVPPTLGSDTKVTDAEGSPLYLRKIQYGGLEEDPTYYYVYSKTNGALEDLVKQSDCSQTVWFISEGKAASETKIADAMAAIGALGTVTLQSQEQIAQVRKAYDALSEYERTKVTNVSTLTTAERTYQVLYAAYQKQLAEEAAKKAQVTVTESGTTKIVTVNQKRYLIKRAKLKTVKSRQKKALTVSYTADLKCSGYAISYSTSRKFTKSRTKTVLIKKNSTKSKTVKGLRSHRTYYVRMREYRTINGKRYYGKYSVVKKVKVK